jgi:hypothetical protein
MEQTRGAMAQNLGSVCVGRRLTAVTRGWRGGCTARRWSTASTRAGSASSLCIGASTGEAERCPRVGNAIDLRVPRSQNGR